MGWQTVAFRAWAALLVAANTTAAPSDCYSSWSCHGVWIDGQSGCVVWTLGGPYAANCRKVTTREHPITQTTYKDIEDWDIFFNTSGPSHPTWSYSLNHPGDPNVWDFQGVLTHELGHAIRLIDLYDSDCNFGPGMYTMCGDAADMGGYPGSYRLRSITNDDIAGANTVY